jgi:hypothetical protein
MGGPGDGPQLESHGRRDVPAPAAWRRVRGRFSYDGSSGRCGERRESRRVAAALDARLSARAAGLSVPTAVVPAHPPFAGVVVRFRLHFWAEAPRQRLGRGAGGNGAVARPMEIGVRTGGCWQRDRGLFQPWGNHRLSPRTGARRRGSRLGSGVHGRRGPGAAVELSASGQDDDLYASGAGSHRRDPARRAQSAPVDSGSRVSSRNARSSRARSWSPPPSSGE